MPRGAKGGGDFYQLCFDSMDGLSGGVVERQPGGGGGAGPRELAINVVLAGDWGVGKSALAARFCDDVFREAHATTVGVEAKERTLTLPDQPGLRLRVRLLDTPGLDKFRASASAHYQSAHAVALLYDVRRPASFASLQRHLNELKYFVPPDAEIVLIGTKCDSAPAPDSDSGLPESPEPPARVSFEEADAFAARMGLSLFEVSALTGHNVDDAFKELASKMAEKLTLPRYAVPSPDSDDLSPDSVFGPGELPPPPARGYCSWLCV